ncbi:hypothetical protein ACYB2S_13700 [Corynebacterium variabile]|uniref:hypothetical protein n=1 Tax=Corynebacterium variabile TaxID=1727 RepID=UPI003CBC983A
MAFTARDDWKDGDKYPAARMVELEAAVEAKAEKGDKGDKGEDGADGKDLSSEVAALDARITAIETAGE